MMTVVGTAAIAEGGLPNPQSHSAATAAASAARAAGLLLTMGFVSGLQLGSYDPSAHLNQRAPAPRYCHLPPLCRRLSRHAKRTSGGEAVVQKTLLPHKYPLLGEDEIAWLDMPGTAPNITRWRGPMGLLQLDGGRNESSPSLT